MDPTVKLLYVLVLGNKFKVPRDIGYPAGTTALLYGGTTMVEVNNKSLIEAIYKKLIDQNMEANIISIW